GFTTASPLNWWKASSAASAVSHATVSGTGKLAAESRAVVRYLSTAHSRALGGLTTRTPLASQRASKSIRKTTCSKEPGGIVRTMTTSGEPGGSAPGDLASPVRPPGADP